MAGDTDDLCEWEETVRDAVVLCDQPATERRMEDIFLCAAHAARWDRERQAQDDSDEIIVVPDAFPVIHYIVEVTFENGTEAYYGTFDSQDEANGFVAALEKKLPVALATVLYLNGVIAN